MVNAFACLPSPLAVYRTPDLANTTLAFIATILQILLYAAHFFTDRYVVRHIPVNSHSDFALLVTTTLFWLVLTPSIICEFILNIVPPPL